MKILTIILSFYLLGLNFAPCGDTAVNKSDINSEISQLIDSDHGHSTIDTCSPFCHCNCCHVHTIAFDILKFKPIKLLMPQLHTKYFDGRNKGYQNSLLQPPRV
ncbi:DUF6660 family protein [Polaribacter sp. ALD11]|uniref:DUF6660 family protein n=1 Tax=Polaribacter sp. ALD11 TaxID=2058137 RepID=UPI0012FE2BF4|nr:DUF6660 family protein [Polaribacter sp. ALD11]